MIALELGAARLTSGFSFRFLSNLPSLLNPVVGFCSKTLPLTSDAYNSAGQPARTFGQQARVSPAWGKPESAATMYGMVNSGIQSMVSEQFGEDAWHRIVARVPGCPSEFGALENCDDRVTYDLVAAACEELEMEAERFLHELGEYWIPYASRAGYAVLMERGGRSLPEFLKGLDGMHSRLALTYSSRDEGRRWPSFRVSDVGDASLRLHYYSERQGLQPFVVGLVHGLAKKFGTTVEVELIEGREIHPDHDIFLVRY